MSLVIRLISDDLRVFPKDNAVVSIDSRKPLRNALGLIVSRLHMQSFDGYVLYLCSGKTPRPTRPLLPNDLKLKAKDLGLKQGMYLYCKKEILGVAGSKKALQEHKKMEELKKEDPDAFKKAEAAKEKERAKKLEKAIRKREKDWEEGTDSEPELTKSVVMEEVSPHLVVLGGTLLMAAMDACFETWMDSVGVAKVAVIHAATLLAASVIYTGEREYDRRVRRVQQQKPSEGLSSEISHTIDQQYRYQFSAGGDEAAAQQGRMQAVFRKFVEEYRSKPGDIVDEMLANYHLPPDLAHQRELCLAKAILGMYDKHKAVVPSAVNEVICFAVATTGIHGVDLDRALLWGDAPGRRQDSKEKWDSYVEQHSTNDPAQSTRNTYLLPRLAAALETLVSPPPAHEDPVKQKSAEEAYTQEIESSWAFVRKWAKYLGALLAAVDVAGGTATVWRGLHSLPESLVQQHKGAKRGNPMIWTAPAHGCATQASAEKRLQEGYAASTANPFGKKGPRKAEGNQGTLLLKIVGAGGIDLTPFSLHPSEKPFLISPFTCLEVHSVRPCPNISENSFDIDFKFASSEKDTTFLEDVVADTLRASERVRLVIQEPAALGVTVLGTATMVACIAPILEKREEEARLERERLERLEHLENMHAMAVAIITCAAACSADTAEEAFHRRSKPTTPLPSAPPTPSAPPEVTPLSKPQSLPPSPVFKPPPPPPEPSSLPAPPPRRMAQVDWSQEELELMKRFEQKELERRRQLDEYERMRKEQTDQWERQRREEFERLEKSRQEAFDKRVKEQEERCRQLSLKCEDYEQRLGQITTDISSKQLLFDAQAKELELRRQRLDADQNFATEYLTKLSSQQLMAIEEIKKENETLRAQFLQQVGEVAALRSQVKEGLTLESVLEQTKHLEAKVEGLKHQHSDFMYSPQFAPVLGWLLGIQLCRYAEAFAKNEFDLAACAALKESDLDSMGITAIGGRKRLLEESAKLRERMQRGTVVDGATPKDAVTGAPKSLTPDSGIGVFTLRWILTQFYEKYDPAKVPLVDAIFCEFAGQYDSLFATLTSIYPVYFPSPYRERTIILLKKLCPALLHAVDALLDLFQDNEVELLGMLLRTTRGVSEAISPHYGMPLPSPSPRNVPEAASVISNSPQRMTSESPSRVRTQLLQLLRVQGTPNAEEVCKILMKQFEGHETTMLQAFQEAQVGVSPFVT